MPVNFVTVVKIFNLSIKRYPSLLHLPPTLHQHNFIFYYFKNWKPISGRHLSPSAYSFPFKYWKTWWFQRALLWIYTYTFSCLILIIYLRSLFSYFFLTRMSSSRLLHRSWRKQRSRSRILFSWLVPSKPVLFRWLILVFWKCIWSFLRWLSWNLYLNSNLFVWLVIECSLLSSR